MHGRIPAPYGHTAAGRTGPVVPSLAPRGCHSPRTHAGGTPPQSRRRPFIVALGMCPCLIAAINEANANGEKNTIRLEAGTYTLTAVDNGTSGLLACR